VRRAGSDCEGAGRNILQRRGGKSIEETGSHKLELGSLACTHVVAVNKGGELQWDGASRLSVVDDAAGVAILTRERGRGVL